MIVSLVNFSEKSGLVDLQRLFSGRVTEEHLAIFKVDGSLEKTAKRKLLQLFFQRRHQLSKISAVVLLLWV